MNETECWEKCCRILNKIKYVNADKKTWVFKSYPFLEIEKCVGNIRTDKKDKGQTRKKKGREKG